MTTCPFHSIGSARSSPREYSANGATRRDAALVRARRAEAAGNDAEARYHEQVAAYHESHRIHELRHAELEDALAAGSSVLEFELSHRRDDPAEPPGGLPLPE